MTKSSSIPVRGRLESFSVGHLLKVIMEDSLSGCLTVSRGSITRKLFVNRGMVNYATSTERQDRLGEIFVAQGTLSREEIQEAFDKSGRLRNVRLGMLLLVDDKITSQDLFQGVTAQVVGILERMRSWRKGDFEFDERGRPEDGTVLLRIPLSFYLGAGEKRRKEAVSRKAERKREKASGDERGGEEIEIEMDFEEDAPPAPAGDDAGTAAGGLLEEPVPAGEGDEDGREDEKLIEEITFNVQELRRRVGSDCRTLLGVGPAASAEKVQDAYHYLARLLHHDQHPPGLPADIAREADEFFKMVAAAYQEAKTTRQSSSDAPATMEWALPPPSRVMDRGGEEAVDRGDASRGVFYRAKKYMTSGNYWQAADAMRQVVRMKPGEAMYRNLLGYCLIQTGRRLHEAEEHIKEAIRLDPGNPDFVTNLGLAYKAGRSYKKARNMFQQALLYDKNHRVARLELRKLPGDVERSKKTGSFWKKILGG